MNENFFTKFRIPTLLGLALILFSTGAGVYLVLEGQNITIKAVEENKPQNVIISNVKSDSITVSWQTSTPTTASVSYKEKTGTENKVALDERNSQGLKTSKLHYITLRELKPQTEYHFKLTSGKYVSDDFLEFTTAPESFTSNGYQPILGTVMYSEGKPLEEGIVYISIPGMIDQSTLVANLGNFIIPLSEARSETSLEVYTPEKGQEVKINIFSEDGQEASGKFDLDPNSPDPIGPLVLGWDVNLNKVKTATSSADLFFDLNNDGILNSSDHSIVLNNFGRTPKVPRADLNGDKVVDNKDIQLILSKINESGN